MVWKPRFTEPWVPLDRLAISGNKRGSAKTETNKLLFTLDDDWPYAGLRWRGHSQCESGRFFRKSIRESRLAEKNMFSQRLCDLRKSPQTCDSQFLCPDERRFARKGFSSETPEAIRANCLIRANLRIDSRESGHVTM